MDKTLNSTQPGYVAVLQLLEGLTGESWTGNI